MNALIMFSNPGSGPASGVASSGLQRPMLVLGFVLSCLFMMFSANALAHKSGDAYLRVESAELDRASVKTAPATPLFVLNYSIALRDIDAALEEVDADLDRKLTWGELNQALPVILKWVSSGLRVSCDRAALSPVWSFGQIETRSEVVFLNVVANLQCQAPARMSLNYDLMTGVDAHHRLLVTGSLEGQALAGSLGESRAQFDLRRGPSETTDSGKTDGRYKAFQAFFSEGLGHLLSGLDHLAFLLVLILPLQMRSKPPAASGQPVNREGYGSLACLITAFTIGHSVSLVLAVWGKVPAPAWVEPAIAVTILISAVLNFYRLPPLIKPGLTLVFGVIHGLGFSGALAEASLSTALLPWALAGFNFGIEAGQLMFLLCWCVLSRIASRWPSYDRVVVRGGSSALAFLALIWLVQRT